MSGVKNVGGHAEGLGADYVGGLCVQADGNPELENHPEEFAFCSWLLRVSVDAI